MSKVTASRWQLLQHSVLQSLVATLARAAPSSSTSNNGPGGSVTDVTSDVLSGVSPLILLIGERTTKQVVRDISGLSSAFSLATAPLGLVGIVTSLIRLCGWQHLRAFLGYGLEARAVAAAEITRVNCNGVHAEVVDGHLCRSTSASQIRCASAALCVSGDFELNRREVEGQIERCKEFSRTIERHSTEQSGTSPLRWCLQVLHPNPSSQDCDSILSTVGVGAGIDNAQDRASFTALRNSVISACANRPPMQSVSNSSSSTDRGDPKGPAFVSHRPEEPQLSFVCILDAISELSARSSGYVHDIYVPLLIGIFSAAGIIALFVAELSNLRWKCSPGFNLAVSGYLGIVVSTTIAACSIHYSCVSVTLQTPRNESWIRGVIEMDEENKEGCELYQTRPVLSTYEVVWLKQPSPLGKLFASTVAALLTGSFICHYIGLRSLDWWVSVGELVICIVAAMFRSVTGNEPFRLLTQHSPNVRVGWHCSSTGLLNVQNPVLLAQDNSESSPPLDARAYAELVLPIVPTPSERMAWRVARICVEDVVVSEWFAKVFKMRMVCSVPQSSAHKRALMLAFRGGLLVKEGLAVPQAHSLLGFSTDIKSLAAPTQLFLRAILRQPKWVVLSDPMFDEVQSLFGGVHIPAVDSLISWWSISEQKNKLSELQLHLQWASFFLCVAFFMELIRQAADDHAIKREVDGVDEGIAVKEGATEPALELAQSLINHANKLANTEGLSANEVTKEETDSSQSSDGDSCWVLWHYFPNVLIERLVHWAGALS